MSPRNWLRLIWIQWILIKHGLDDLLFEWTPLRHVRPLRRLLPWHWKLRKTPLAIRLRLALEELGPLYVKFGQLLSTRRDLLPRDFIDELTKLQDQVPPFPGTLARNAIEAAWKEPLDRHLAAFDETPLASASIAQVHAARLHDGRDVVIKIIRPGIDRLIKRDLILLDHLAYWVERYWGPGVHLHPRAIVAKFAQTLHDELNLLQEAGHASQLRRNFKDSPFLEIPEIIWELTRERIMVMERIYGIPIHDFSLLRAHGVDFRELAQRGVSIFFTQVFRDNFFHADMHPGNLFVDLRDPLHPRYQAVDFGIMGTLTEEDRHYLAANFLAFFNRDYRQVARLHLLSGWVPPQTPLDELEAAIRSVCEPIFNRPLKEISLGQLLIRLFQTARRFNVDLKPELVLLQKTLIAVEGLGRQLDPDLDLWKSAKPLLERWMRQQVSPLNLLRHGIENWPALSWGLQAWLDEATHRMARNGPSGSPQPADPVGENQESLPRPFHIRLIVAGLVLASGFTWVALDLSPKLLGPALLVLSGVLLAYLWWRPH
jgi:ubiquinone biosynthesis protein